MEVLRRASGVNSRTAVRVLVLCLLGMGNAQVPTTQLPNIIAGTNTAIAITQAEGATSSGQRRQHEVPGVVADVLGGSRSNSTSDQSVEVKSGLADDWHPVPERELLPERAGFSFYQITNGFLQMIQPRTIMELRGLFDFNDWRKTGENFEKNWMDVLMYAIGFAICSVIGVLLLIIVPVSGIFIGCCRCCGNCGGGKINPRDGPSASCQRCCCGFLLFSFLAFVLTGGILMIVFSGDIQNRLNGKQSIFDDISNSFLTLSEYSQDSLEEMRESTLVRFQDTSSDVFAKVDGVIPEVKDQINATQPLDSLRIFADSLPLMDDVAENVTSLSKNYTTKWTQLNKTLETTISGVNSIMILCNADECKEALDAVNNLTLDADFSGVQFDGLKLGIKNIVAKNLSGIVSVAVVEFNNVFKLANDTLQAEIEKAKEDSKKVEGSIASLISKMENIMASETLEDWSDALIKAKGDFNEAIHMNLAFALLSMAAFILVIVLFYYIGLLYGFCGERPDPKDSQCCTWKTGSCWLLVGIVFTYLFYIFLIIVLLAFFLAGGLIYTEVCRHVYDLPHSEAKDFFDDVTQSLLPKTFTFTLSKTYMNCVNNESIYIALQMKNNGVNLDKIINMDEINKAIDGIKRIDIDIGTVSFLPDDIESEIYMFERTLESVSDEVAIYSREANKGVANRNFTEVAELLEIAANATNNPSSINSLASDLRTYQSNDVFTLGSYKEALSVELDNLQKYVSQNLTVIIKQLENAETILNNTASDIVKSSINNTADIVKESINVSVAMIKSDVEFNIGRCHPVYEAVSTLVNSACVQTLYPLNAYVFAMGMALAFLLPSILCAFKLMTLYRKSKRYAAIEATDQDLYMAYHDSPYSGGKDTQNDMLLHRVDRPKSDYIAMADNPVYTIDDEMPVVGIPRAVMRIGTRVLPAQPAAPDDRYFYAMPSHGYQRNERGYPRGGSEPPPSYATNPVRAGV